MSSRHIVLVSSYYPPHLGGQENAVQGLAQSLAQAGHKVTVIASTQGGGARGTSIENGVQVQRLPSIVFGHAPIMPLFPVALFKAAKPDSLVHLHIGQAFTPEMVWLVAKMRGFSYIAQLHIDFEASGPAGILLPLYKKWVLKPVLHAAAAVITLNKKTHDTVRSAYQHTGKAVIMNNGLDESFFKLKRQPLAAQPPDILRLLFVGRFSKQKNLVTLLKAVAATKRRIHLDIVGEGAEDQAVRATIDRLQLKKQVSLHGRLAQQDVMKFYKTCDALIMPSLYEAQPLVLLEAMAARIPIIGTQVIGVEDHINGIGILVEPTIAGLVKGIDQFYAQYHALPAMVEKGYAKASKLRWPQTLKHYESLYEQILPH